MLMARLSQAAASSARVMLTSVAGVRPDPAVGELQVVV